MNRNEFIQRLSNNLRGIPESEIKDILYDYEEHFEVGLSKGKTEEEIAKDLGDPKNISKSYKASSMISEAEINPSSKNFLKALLAAMTLGIFNLIIVLAPFILLVGLLIGLYGISFGFTIGGLTLFISTIAPTLFPNSISLYLHPVTSISFGVGMTTLGILMVLACFYLTQLLYKVTIKYLKWNIDIIKR